MSETMFTPFSTTETAELEAHNPKIDAPTEYPNGINLPTFEIALVLAGAVSAGAYTAGVLDYLLETLDLWEAEKVRLAAANVPLADWTVPPHAVRLRVVSGASAGSICAALLGIAARYKFAPVHMDATPAERAQNLFYRSWVTDIDINSLLKSTDLDATKDKLFSVLDSSPLDVILKYAVDYTAAPAPQRRYFGSSLAVFMTLSNLRGVPYNFELNGTPGLVYGASRHADAMRFRIFFDASGIARPDEIAVIGTNTMANDAWKLLGASALASSAFPVGLKARILSRPAIHYGKLPYIREKLYAPDPRPAKLPEDLEQPIAGRLKNDLESGDYRYVNVDGGVMNNEPFELARRELAGLTGRNDRRPEIANRAVILVDPFPDVTPPPKDDDAALELQNSIGALFTALKNQTRFSTSDMDALADDEVRSRFVMGPSRLRPDGQVLTGSRAIAGGAVGGFSGFLYEPYREHDFLLGRYNAELFLRDYFVLPRENPLFARSKGNLYCGSADAPHAFNAIEPRDDGSYQACIIPRVGASTPEHLPAALLAPATEEMKKNRFAWIFTRLDQPQPIWPGPETGKTIDLKAFEKALDSRLGNVIKRAAKLAIAGSPWRWFAGIFVGPISGLVKTQVTRLAMNMVRTDLIEWQLIAPLKDKH